MGEHPVISARPSHRGVLLHDEEVRDILGARHYGVRALFSVGESKDEGAPHWTDQFRQIGTEDVPQVSCQSQGINQGIN